MSEYVAPIKEMHFVLKELADLSTVCDLPGYEEASEDVIEAVIEEASKLAGGVLAPLNVVGDEKGSRVENGSVIEAEGFAEAYNQFVEGGWCTLAGNPEFGGMGLPELVASATSEMWAAANISFALCPMLTVGAMGAIETHASDEIKQVYLENMVSGAWTGTMNLTEPQAGSDLAAVRAKAMPEGDHFRISGTKIFITWGDHGMTENVIHLVLARTPDAPEGVKGISLFVVPKFMVNDDGSVGEKNDVHCVSVEHKMGIHASPTCIMSFGDNDGAVGYLVGEENHGLAYMFTMMNHARLHVGVQGVAQSDRAYQHAVEYAKDRVQGVAPGMPGKSPILHHPDVRRMLMLMRAFTEASRALNYVAAAELDKAHHATDPEVKLAATKRLELLTPIAKAWATEVSQEVTSLGVQVHGGMGYVEETGAAQYMRDTRITTIYEGTTGIQANDLIGRKLIRDGAQEFSKLIAEMQATEAELKSAGEQFSIMASALNEGITQLDDAAQWVIAHHKDNPLIPGAASVNFLMLAGTVIGGWLMAKSALISQGKLAEDTSFYSAKIITAQFYAEHIMSRAYGYTQAVKAGSDSMMALTEDQL
jgi:acyl-CoA dehydrogenase